VVERPTTSRTHRTRGLSTPSDNLLVRFTLPESAGNDLQGQSSVIGDTFTGPQRAAAAR
jgi:hypothetical protein